MPSPGQRIVNPVTGERIVFRERREGGAAGDTLVFDVELRPGGIIAGPPHHHPFAEHFQVTSGRLAGWVAGRGPVSRITGEEMMIPAGVDHVVFNGALGWTRARVEASPIAEFDRLLESAFALSTGHLNEIGRVARLMRDQRVLVALVPDGAQEVLLGAAATLAGPLAPEG